MIPTFQILFNATKSTTSSADPNVNGKYCFSSLAFKGLYKWKTFHNLVLVSMKPDSNWFSVMCACTGITLFIYEALRKRWALFLL